MVGVVVNKFAGRGRAWFKYEKEVKPCLVSANVRFVEIIEEDVLKMQNAIREHMENGLQYLVVIGGDGTLNRVIEVLLGTDVRVIPYPGGTGNDFMKSIENEDLNCERMIDCLKGKCKHVAIDIGLVSTDSDQHIFINGLGIGFDADVLNRLPHIPFLKGDALYFTAVVLSLFKRRTMKFEMEIEGKKRLMKDYVVFDIGNGKYLGGGFKLFPYSKFTDRMLSYIAIKNSSIRKVFGVLVDVMREKFSNPLVRMGKFGRMRLSFEREVLFHTDGDLIGASRKFDIGILDEKVGVLV